MKFIKDGEKIITTNKLSPEIFNAQADALARLAQAFSSAVKDGEVDYNA